MGRCQRVCEAGNVNGTGIMAFRHQGACRAQQTSGDREPEETPWPVFALVCVGYKDVFW